MDTKNINWWTGVIEDRNDPEKLGRCRVRIFGYHTDDTSLLPTPALPWAIPLQSIFSSANSGVGTSPTGIVEGTWVMGIFLDGDEAQKPVMLGTIAGKPKINTETQNKITKSKTENNVLRDGSGNPVFDGSGNPVQVNTYATEDDQRLKPLTTNNYKSLTDNLGKQLSNNDYKKVGNNNELGKYQIDASNLILLGYVKNPGSRVANPDILNDNSFWVNKDGINSKESFLNNTSVQEKIMLELTKKNYDTLVRLGKITDKDEVPVVAGLLASAHVIGARNADKLDKKTADGKPAREYFVTTNSAFGGDDTDFDREFADAKNYLAQVDNELENNQTLSQNKGFQDPNKKYPKYEYAGKVDINKLAVGDTSHLSFKVKENNRVDKIPLARSTQTWDEPDSGYAGVYPYNQVIETEAGHVIEIDSTPNAERIHVYHKKGTYIEIDVNGTMVRKVVGDNYEVMDRNNFVYVRGAHNLTVEGKTNILVKNDASIEVQGSLNVTGHGSTLVQTADTLGLIGDKIIISGKSSVDIVSGGSLNVQGKTVNQYAKGGALTIKSDQDLSLQSGSGSNLSLKGGLAALLDAVLIKTKMGANAIRGIALGVIPPPDKKEPSTVQVPVLKRTLVRDEVFLFDSGEEGSEDYKNEQIAEGKINDTIVPKSVPSGSTISTEPPVTKITEPNAGETLQYNTFPRTFKISRYYVLADVLVGNRGTALVAQRGLSEAEIVNNLRVLGVNCLDKIKEKFPDVVITSGFRIGPEGSDHNIGCAADLMFRKTDFEKYKDNIDWIQKNVPYKQLLLEYRFNESSNKLEAAWIHISLQVSNGSIVRTSRAPTATFKNHSVYASNQFVNLA
jgi:hypothetical protein